MHAFIAILVLQLDPGRWFLSTGKLLPKREQQFGLDHPKVARSASDLGLYLRNLGDRSGALPYLERALAIDTKTLSSTDKRLAEDLENLASVSSPDAALPLHQKSSRHR